jgi:DNA-binding CsgD family transcriptional regulator
MVTGMERLGPESPLLAREMPGTGERSGLLLEAAPIVPTGATSSNSVPPYRVLICVSLSEDQPSKMASFRDSFDLTVAECRVAAEAAKGRTPAEIALAIGLSVHTVRSHLKRIFIKIGVHSQAALVWALLHRHKSIFHASRHDSKMPDLKL